MSTRYETLDDLQEYLWHLDKLEPSRKHRIVMNC